MPPFITINRKDFTSLKGRTALITGGSSGIGLSTALLLHSFDCQVIIGDLQPPPTSIPSSIVYQHCEVSSYASLLSLFDKSKSHFGTYPDIILANAGIGERGDLFGTEVSDEDIRKEPAHEVIGVDIVAVANTVRIGWWGCRKEGKEGNIIITASVAGYQGQAGLAMYNAAKHACVGLVRSLRTQGRKSRIAISLIAPAITSTPLLTSEAADYTEVVKGLKGAGVPMNTAEDIANGLYHLISLRQQSNGMGLMVQGGLFVDVERGIAEGRPNWMGEEMARMYKGGKGADPFEKMLGTMGKPKEKL